MIIDENTNKCDLCFTTYGTAANGGDGDSIILKLPSGVRFDICEDCSATRNVVVCGAFQARGTHLVDTDEAFEQNNMTCRACRGVLTDLRHEYAVASVMIQLWTNRRNALIKEIKEV